MLIVLFLATAPLLIFSTKPESSMQRRIGCILIAVIIGYILLNIIVELGNQNGWRDYEQCRSESKNRMDSPEMHDECGHYIVDSAGINNMFIFFIGWIPAGGYAGFFELLWRRKHRETIQKMGNQFKDKWFSNFMVITAIPVWIFMFLIMLLIVVMQIYCFIDFPNGKC